MLTEEFKQKALEKLKSATPEHVIEILKAIGSVSAETSSSQTPTVSFSVDNDTIVLEAMPLKLVTAKPRSFNFVFEGIEAEYAFTYIAKKERLILSNADNEEGYAA